MSDVPPDEGAVREACRLLEGKPGISVAGELVWWPDLKGWTLPIRVSIRPAEDGRVAAETDWYAFIDGEYPLGKLDFYPARAGGLKGTFPHQDRNGDRSPAYPWTEGDICFRVPEFVHGRHAGDPEPLGEPDRLAWCAERARQWVQDAADGRLTLAGDHYELPRFETETSTVGYCEDEDSYQAWRASSSQFGSVELVALNDGGALAARRFTDERGREIVAPRWGFRVANAASSTIAGWLRLDHPPIRPPYETPATWGALREAIRQQGQDADELLRGALRLSRAVAGRMILVGLPIPRRVGEASSVMHWQPLFVPSPTSKGRSRGGFRDNEAGRWAKDRVSLHDGRRLSWLVGENWHADVLKARGRLAPELTSRQVTLVGAGALGSAVAELLVRGGVCDVEIVDAERLTVGNLVRHALSLDDVGHHKAERLAARLNRLSPFARVTALARNAGRERRTDPRQGVPRLVLDCTGSDEAFARLCMGPPEPGTLLVSFSMGLGAGRLYVYAIPGMAGTLEAFRSAMQPWLQRDREESQGMTLRPAGPGCWHPVFPGRPDQVWIHASAAVQELERLAAKPSDESTLTVFELRHDGQGSMAYARAAPVPQ